MTLCYPNKDDIAETQYSSDKKGKQNHLDLYGRVTITRILQYNTFYF